MSDLMEVNDNNFQTAVLGSGEKILVDFWAPWCGPCRMQTPILERLVKSEKTKAKIVKLNTDESPQTARNYHVDSIPTLIIFKDGKEIDRMVGVQPEGVLADKLK